jgi:hypothetical protein
MPKNNEEVRTSTVKEKIMKDENAKNLIKNTEDYDTELNIKLKDNVNDKNIMELCEELSSRMIGNNAAIINLRNNIDSLDGMDNDTLLYLSHLFNLISSFNMFLTNVHKKDSKAIFSIVDIGKFMNKLNVTIIMLLICLTDGSISDNKSYWAENIVEISNVTKPLMG